MSPDSFAVIVPRNAPLGFNALRAVQASSISLAQRLDANCTKRFRNLAVELRTNQNDRNESQIVFAWDDSSNYLSLLAFYAGAVRRFWGDSESSIGVETYIGNAEEIERDVGFMQQEIEGSIGITPIDDVPLDFKHITDCRTFRYDWNIKELVWRSNATYWYMLWETAA